MFLALFTLSLLVSSSYQELPLKNSRDYFDELIVHLKDAIDIVVTKGLDLLNPLYEDIILEVVVEQQKSFEDLEKLAKRAFAEIKRIEETDPSVTQECVNKARQDLSVLTNTTKALVEACFTSNLEKVRLIYTNGKDSYERNYQTIPKLEKEFKECRTSVCNLLAGSKAVFLSFTLEESIGVITKSVADELALLMPPYKSCLITETSRYGMLALEIVDGIKDCGWNFYKSL